MLDVIVRGLSDKTDDVGAGFEQRGELSIVLRSTVGSAGRAERDQLGATLTGTQKRLNRAEKTAERARTALSDVVAERDALKARLDRASEEGLDAPDEWATSPPSSLDLPDPWDDESGQLEAPPSLPAGPGVAGELTALLDAIVAQRESAAKNLASWAERETSVGKTIGALLKIASTVPQLQSGDSNIYGVLGDLKAMLDAGEGSLTESVEELQAREDALRDVLGRLTD